MGSMMATVGYVAVGAILLAILVLITVSWIKGRPGGEKAEEQAGGSGVPDSTPGDW